MHSPSDRLVQHQRDHLVRSLVLDSLDKLQADHLSLWLHTILEAGFVGFANMSDEELRRECRRRGLRLEDRLDEPQDEEYDDDPDEEEDELLALFADSRAAGVSSRP